MLRPPQNVTTWSHKDTPQEGRRVYPEVQLGGIFLPFMTFVVPLHGSGHGIVLLLPSVLLDLHTTPKRMQ